MVLLHTSTGKKVHQEEHAQVRCTQTVELGGK